MVKTVFLDLDDTLLDFQGAEASALPRAFEKMGMECSPELLARYHVINQEQWRCLEKGLLTRPQVLTRRFDLLFEEWGIQCSSVEICRWYENFLAEECRFLPGAKELLEKLAPRYRLYLATNGTAKIQRRRLELSGIERYLQGVFISEEMGANKPDAAYFHACFAKIPDFDPAAALIVGDSLSSDIRGGKNAGIRTCWFNPDGAAHDPEIVPDYEIRELSELLRLLESL